VHAYADRDNNNAPDDGTDPDGGAGLDFSFALDLDDRPLDYRDAAVTNLFYWNNIVHDVLHAHGFDEAAGNFQVNNYGRGGTGGDDVRAEAQDGSGRNNANFGTGVEGVRPRMQMFEWRSALPNPIVVAAPSPIAGTYFGPMAGFGESLVTTGPISGEVVYVGRGCDPAYPVGNVPPIPLDPYLADPAGKIALIDRGTCTFVSKVKKAEDLGALMVIVANNAPGPAVAMGGADPTITIPSVMVTQDDGNLFRANTPFNATISDGTGGAPDRDSDLDAGVIAHEYGHGWSNRLTGGPAVVNCLNNQEQMGEGWSDFLAIAFTANRRDTPTLGRGVGTYVAFEPATGVGIRPRQYTTNVSVNEFTYGSIPGGVASGVLTIPHGIGFVWNTMLNEVYWNLVVKHGFNSDIYEPWHTGGNNLALRLVSDGLKFQPCRPGFVDGRNGILAADVALTGGENQCAIWRGFAKRGLGFSANQGSNMSATDGTQAFDLPPTCAPQFGGFQSPTKAPPEVNTVRAGSKATTRFVLTESRGEPDIAAAFATQQVDCTTHAPSGPVTALSGDLDNSKTKFRFDWRSNRAWDGTCRQLIVRIQDVSDPVALYRFT
jgi:extracellular elastinolytic metalloproteinase